MNLFGINFNILFFETLFSYRQNFIRIVYCVYYRLKISFNKCKWKDGDNMTRSIKRNIIWYFIQKHVILKFIVHVNTMFIQVPT